MYNSAKCSCINNSSFDFQQKETKKKINKENIYTMSINEIGKQIFFIVISLLLFFYTESLPILFFKKRNKKTRDSEEYAKETLFTL